MNRYVQNIFLILFPFLPIWAWGLHFASDIEIGKVVNMLLLPFALNIIFTKKIKVPAYLVLFILFTIYHLLSVYMWNLLPDNTNWPSFIVSDMNVFAVIVLLIVENSEFDREFFRIMGRNILIVLLLSLAASIIQIKSPMFMFNESLLDGLIEGDQRNASIYSFMGFNSGGITFPILVSLMLSIHDFKSWPFSLSVFSGIVVSFLTKSRYVMISTIMAISQLFFDTRRTLQNRITIGLVFLGIVFGAAMVANEAGFNIQEVIDSRILEKENDMGSAKARLTSYNVFLLKFPEHPWFGVGPKTRDDVVALLLGEAPLIHVGYLSYLYFYGIAGCSFLFLSLILLLREGWIAGRRRHFWGSFYGVIGFCLANATFVYFNLSEMGIVLAVLYLRHYTLNIETEEEEEFSEEEYPEKNYRYE